MKSRVNRNLPRTLVLCLAPLLACASARATVVTANESNGSGVWTLPTGTNLLTGTTATPTPATHEGSSASWSTVTDGTLGDGAPTTSVTPSDGSAVTFPLDLVAQPAGYNVTSFDSYCTWGNSGRDNQDYTLQYSTVADPTNFITIASVYLHTGSDRSTHTCLTNDAGFLATGVAAIRVKFAGQENGYVGYREFVLQDTPSVVCVNNEVNTNNVWVLPSGPNLLTGTIPSPATVAAPEGSSGTWSTVIDGSLGDYTSPATSATPDNGNTVTFPLDLVAKPAGYDITAFDSYCAWGSNGRDDSNYTLQYSTVADPTVFTTLTNVANHSEFNGPNSSKATHTRVTGNGAPMAVGVAAIKLIFNDQENGYVGYREFMLRDTPLPKNVLESNSTNLWTLPAGTNLLNGANASPFSTSTNEGSSALWSTVTNGVLGIPADISASVTPPNDATVTFPLDTSVNFNGYNVSSFDAYCAWPNSGRDNQDFTLRYSTVEDPATFIPLESAANHTGIDNSTHTRLAPASGFLAKRVAALQLTFANQENGFVGYRELIALGSAVALAESLTWTGGSGTDGSSSWVTTPDNNWKLTDTGVPANFNTLAALTFDDSGVNPNIGVPVALTASALSFTNDAAHPYAISGELVTVSNAILSSGAGIARFNNSVKATTGVTLLGSGTLAFNGALEATGLTVSGTGGIVLNAANPALTGNSSVTNGTLTVANDQGLEFGALVMTAGTTRFTSAAPLVASIAGTSGAVILLGNPTGPATTTLALGDAVSATLFAGNIGEVAGSASRLTKAGASSLVLSGDNTYTGATTVIGGTLELAQRLSLYHGTTASWTADNIVVNGGGTLDFRVGDSGEFTEADLTAVELGGFAPGAMLGLDTSADFTLSRNLTQPGLGLVKSGLATLNLTGTNTSNGLTKVISGALNAANLTGPSIGGNVLLGAAAETVYFTMGTDNQFGPDSVITMNNANFYNTKMNLRGTSQTIAGLDSTPTNRVSLIQNDEVGNPGYTTNPGPASLTINATTDHSFYGLIRNYDGAAVTVIKDGPGTQEFLNAAVAGFDYTGPTLINGGKLRLNFNGGTSGFSSDVTVNSPGGVPATLEFDGTFTFSRPIAGAGKVVKAGTGTVTLTNGASSYTGGTTVNSGTLLLTIVGGTGEGTGPGQTCIVGAMTPTNVVTVNGPSILSLNFIAPFGNSNMLPQYAPSVRINEGAKLYGGTDTVAFVPNLTLDGGTVEITNGAGHGGFNTDLTFVGTVVVGGTSTLPSTIFTSGTGAYANASLGSVGLPGTTFQVADVTTSSAPDLSISSDLRDVANIRSRLIKTGPGTLSLQGSKSYTGSTQVVAGELQIGYPYLADTADVSIDATGTLALLHGSEDTINFLTLASVTMAAGTYGSMTNTTPGVIQTPLITGDGMLVATRGPVTDPYEFWALRIPDENKRGRTADPDGDSFTNLQEYLFGTVPTAGNGTLTTTENVAGGLIVHWNQLATGTAVYSLQESATLAAGSWLPSSAAALDSAVQDLPGYVRKQALIQMNAPSRFVRVEGAE
jgi:autotransporter-associated beta strand protein